MKLPDKHSLNQPYMLPDDISVICHLNEKLRETEDVEDLDIMIGGRVALPESSYAILNADDDLVYELRDELFCEIALFSLYPENRRVKRHCRRGGLAAIIENNYLVLCMGERKIPLLKLPLHFNDKSKALATELLPYILAARINKFPVRQITRALRQLLSSRQGETSFNPLFSA
ncbi:MAG: cyanophycin synthetase [Crocinitomicaceae bacterium]|jgi:cyanophycin synthetase|nr:cyanophycin synthetase [Crocinitomicaceae bacterium]